MPNPAETPDKEKTDNNQKWVLLSKELTLLLYTLILCSAVLFTAYSQPRTTYALAPTVTENATAENAQLQTSETTTKIADMLATTPSIWPTKGAVTSGFGWRNSPFGDGNELHPGIDIANNIGTPVAATADGRVVQSDWSGGYGNIVEIDHGNGITTIYGHNSQLAVSVGQNVKKGQVISYAGSTGKSTGPHVHYEVRENGTAVDPWKYLVF